MFTRFCLFWKNYRLIAADLNKQKALDADSRAIQQIIFTSKIKATSKYKSNNLSHFEQLEDRILEFAKGTTKVL